MGRQDSCFWEGHAGDSGRKCCQSSFAPTLILAPSPHFVPGALPGGLKEGVGGSERPGLPSPMDVPGTSTWAWPCWALCNGWGRGKRELENKPTGPNPVPVSVGGGGAANSPSAVSPWLGGGGGIGVGCCNLPLGQCPQFNGSWGDGGGGKIGGGGISFEVMALRLEGTGGGE